MRSLTFVTSVQFPIPIKPHRHEWPVESSAQGVKRLCPTGPRPAFLYCRGRGPRFVLDARLKRAVPQYLQEFLRYFRMRGCIGQRHAIPEPASKLGPRRGGTVASRSPISSASRGLGCPSSISGKANRGDRERGCILVWSARGAGRAFHVPGQHHARYRGRATSRMARMPRATSRCVRRSWPLTPKGGSNTIIVPAGTYLLTIPGASEDEAQPATSTSKERSRSKVRTQRTTVIDGNNLDRVFQMLGGKISISNLTIREWFGRPGSGDSELGRSGHTLRGAYCVQHGAGRRVWSEPRDRAAARREATAVPVRTAVWLRVAALRMPRAR